MTNYCVEITYEITGRGGFQNPVEAYKFIAAYVHKNADDEFKPYKYYLRWFRVKEFDKPVRGYKSQHYHRDDENRIIFVFYKEFAHYTDLILWVQKTEELLDKFLEDHKNDIQKTQIERIRHKIFQWVIKKTLFRKKSMGRNLKNHRSCF